MPRLSVISRLACFALIVAAGCSGGKAAPTPASNDTARSAAKSVVDTPPTHVALVPPPVHVRGLYVNRWAALGDRMWQLIDVAKRTEVNALVIDVKDDRGFVLYRSRVPLAREIGADTNRPMSDRRVRAILDTMRMNGIYPIARIVVAKDPMLAEHKLEWAIKSRRDPSQPWHDAKGKPWLDAHQPGVWQYAVDLAKEAVALGFSEVQFDYMRFPDAKGIASETIYPLANGRVRAQVIRDQLAFSRAQIKPLGVRFTGDVFGLTATDSTDMGIGQRWESFADQLDVVLPMAYPSHYAPGTYKLGNPNAHPYETIAHTLKDAKRRSATITGAGVITPWYQDFTLGPPHYFAPQVRAQMKAGYDNGVESWILWNPRSAYTVDALEKDR